ncbi:NYN domain-containing protein [Salinarchaeum laminariae]|uniref:NYN domain-containing protein n=1 Tax=Salinarchaeum laminariae TaxID=869888 RepID=UPI0020BD7C4C|nr:NYN domain-containing protein [Salinarchaeum laminariae]
MRWLRGLFGFDDEASGAPESTAASAPNREPRVGLFVDGPNVLREDFSVDLDDVREAGAAHGPLAISRCYLDENAPASLIQAAEARGFEVVVTSGDVDVRLAVDATAAIGGGVGGDSDVDTGGIDVLALASRDTDFKPVLERARKAGIRTVALPPGEYGNSDALANAADEAVVLEER